ncbi:hypothetical protein [Atribacter laminatus]|uniref:Uncharacterized protein n=1 Tax=Atribacter laminatus TaxID=2847778 RepID=A0A7T1AP29_ATRLM|nr:hypothetical protein [Atribacter laminatus]QPM69454.1 hypothetical protein RT761_02687 [Atribacter laminatus]
MHFKKPVHLVVFIEEFINLNKSQKMIINFLKFIIILIIFLLAYQSPAVSNNQQPGLSFFTSFPSEFILKNCQPDNSYDFPFSIDIENNDSQWVVYAFLNQTDKKIDLSKYFFLLASSAGKEEIVTNQEKPVVLIEGLQPVPTQSLIGEFILRFKPDWDIPAGQYQFELLFAYQSNTLSPPISLPYKIPVTIIIDPTVLLNVDIQPQDGLQFDIQGQPGLYAAENRILLNGKANVEKLTILCWAEDLKGKNGHLIPNSRIFLTRSLGTKKTEMISLEKPLEIQSFQIGEPISLVIEGFYIKTLLEDLPDEYEGLIHFDYFIPVNEKEK